MTTTMNDADRAHFLQTLRSDPDFRDEVRSLLLGEELLRLPERFAQFSAYVNDFIEGQKAFNEEQRAFNARVGGFIERQEETNARQEETNARVSGFIERQEETNARQEETNARVGGFIERQEETNARQEETNAKQAETNARVERRLQQITDDLGDLKGHVAGRVAREMADDIAEGLGFELVETLRGNDLRRMLRRHNPSDIASGTRRSFYLADLVGKVLDQEGNERFIAVEASYTADQRDVDRAVRNAEFLTRFTGIAATPVVASRQNDRAVQQVVADGGVLWFEFSQRDLTPQ